MKEKLTNVLFLVGNGYDLHNGLETSYQHFISNYIFKAIKEGIEDNFKYNDKCFHIYFNISYKEEIREFVDDLTNKYNYSSLVCSEKNMYHQYINKPPYFYIEPKNDFVENILKYCFNTGWSGIENEIYNFLKLTFFHTENSKRNKENPTDFSFGNRRIESLNDSIACLKDRLIKYLEEQIPKKSTNIWNKILLKYKDIIEKDNLKFDNPIQFQIINFNYTTYMNNHINEIRLRYETNNPFKICRINYIHGRIDGKREEIIFGIGDEQEEFLKKVESYCTNEWLYPMKSYKYLRNDNYQDLLGFIESGDYIIYIVGHSCGITDRTLLKMLFENENCKGINLLHRGIESYMTTSYNISRNFNDKIKLRKILMPFDENLSFE